MKKLASLVALVIVFVLSANHVAFALSPEQKKLFDLGVMQFDIDTEECAETDDSASSITLTGNSNTAKAFNYLVGQGLTDFQAAGIVGNLLAESSLIPDRAQGGGTQTIDNFSQVVANQGFGIAQWTTAGRQEAWGNFAKKKNLDPLSLELQLMYLWHELETVPDYGLEEITKSKDLEQATWIFLAYFERPASVSGLTGTPTPPTSGSARDALNERIKLAEQASNGGSGGSTGSSAPAVDTSAEGKPTCVNEQADGAFEFTVGTYNMCDESIHSDCPVRDRKADVISKNIQGNDALGNKDQPFDIVTGQEVSPATLKGILGNLPEYKSFPTPADWADNNGRGVLYNTEMFKEVDSGKANGVLGNGNLSEASNKSTPWVKLETDSGQGIFVMSVHFQVNNAGDRRKSTEALAEWAKDRVKSSDLVVIGGDFNNSGTTDSGGPSSYCTLTKEGLLQHAYDLAEGKDPAKACPSPSENRIDQIYSSTNVAGLQAEKWRRSNASPEVRGTDHGPSWVTYFADGGEGGIYSANGYTFPLRISREGITKNEPAWCFDNKDNCHHDYNAADIFAPTGTEVLATRGGKVTSAKDVSSNPSSIGTRISILGDDGWLYYYAHMGANTLKVRDGQTIKAGTVLGKVGTSANAAGTDPHLHIDRLPGAKYKYRVSCAGASCSGYPFDNIQELMSNVFKAVK